MTIFAMDKIFSLTGATALGLDIGQLFMDGRRLHLARDPNFQEETKTNSDAASNRETNAAWDDQNFPICGGTSADAIARARVGRWSNPTSAFIHALHEARWGSKHYRVVGVDSSGNFSLQGGWQENRGGGFSPFFRGGYHKELLFVENAFEELDAPGEFYFNRKTDCRRVDFDGRRNHSPPQHPLSNSTGGRQDLAVASAYHTL